jgi:ubiquinone biosynthesis protein COQ9
VDAGYLAASTNLFPRGPFELVNFHLVTQRLGLRERVQFVDEREKGKGMGVGRKVRALTWARLRGNEEAGVVGRWDEVCFFFLG